MFKKGDIVEFNKDRYGESNSFSKYRGKTWIITEDQSNGYSVMAKRFDIPNHTPGSWTSTYLTLVKKKEYNHPLTKIFV